MTIVEFLEARLAEDEAAARAAAIGSPSWHLGDFDETVLWWPPASPAQVAFIRERLGVAAAERDASWGGVVIPTAGEQIAPHIARHDPARVLREVGAKRRVVAEHPQIADWDCERCHRDGDEPEGRPCATLRALASVYADHPDYDQAWAVDTP